MLFIVFPAAVWGRLLFEESNNNDDEPDDYVKKDQMIFAPFQLDDNPTFFGNGCLGGNVEVILPDFGQEEGRATVTVLFSQYMATTLGPITSADMSCSMDLPVHVEPGRSVGIFQIDYRGYAYVPVGGEARFDTEYFFAGQPGSQMSRAYGGGGSSHDTFDGVFLETDIIEAIAWSECGSTADFRINTSLLASKPTTWSQDVFISLDSKDINTDGFHVTFASRPC